jgi:glyoxylase-like metal-dependent hydrolase (beta-lactamase superfamily II)
VELLYVGPAHTWGDVVVFLPQHRILFAGDVTFSYVTPAAFNGHITKWLETLDRIAAMDVDTIVPGHGPIHGKQELADLREYYSILKSEGQKRFEAGVSPGRAAFEVQTQHLGKFSGWNNPERVVADTVRLYDELRGTLTPAGAFAPAEATKEYNALKETES